MIDLTRDVPPAAKAMTDNELNALIAEKVMGWSDVSSNEVAIFGRPPRGHWQHQFMTIDIPDYCNDIAAAWQVVEKHPHYISLIRSNDNGRFGFKETPTWKCRFYAPEKFEAEADTATRAICLAALEAIKVNGQ